MKKVIRERNRLKLALRAEQSLGVTAVVRSKSKFVQPAESEPADIESPPAAVQIPPPAAATSLLAAAPFAGEPLPTRKKLALLQAMNEDEVRVCRRCILCETRTNTVFGVGDVDAKLMFIGEGPGENEDLQGEPFVGKAGQLLNRMISAMGLSREQVFIANIVKCRPPNNRVPAPEEVLACTPYLLRQIEIIRPRVIVTLGLPATQYMLETKSSMSSMRGQFHDWRGIKVMPTYHPAYVLRKYTETVRAAVWSDLQKVMRELGLKGPGAKSPASAE